VPVTQKMGILNVQHHCNTRCKVVMSLDDWAVEMQYKAAFGHMEILKSIF
jgi:hypothetical protein